MNRACTVKITTNFKAPLWEWVGMLVGYTYPKTAIFKDKLNVDIDITADDFSLEIKDSTGTTVDTLTLTSGLEIADTNKLNILVGSPVTDTAGTYTGILVWTRTATGGITPCINFTFLVE